MPKFYVESAPEKPFGVRMIVVAQHARAAAESAIDLTQQRKGKALLEDIVYISQAGFLSDREMPQFENDEQEHAWFEQYTDDEVLEVVRLRGRYSLVPFD